MTSTFVSTQEQSLSLSRGVSTLARVEILRFLRHPLFLLGAVGFLLIVGIPLASGGGGIGADPLFVTMPSSFFIGVFGFAVAHRLATSFGRQAELVRTAPVDRRARTVALLLSCVVPALTSMAVLAAFSLYTGVRPPAASTPDAAVAWFGDLDTVDVLAVLLAGGPLTALGGALLGVAVARWAPFRGSVLVGVVVLVLGTVALSPAGLPVQIRVLSPYVIFGDETVVDGKIVAARLIGDINPLWYCLYVVCLCALAALAALLKDGSARVGLLRVGAAVGLVAMLAAVLAAS